MTAGRQVTLVLCTRDTGVLGALPPFDVPSPWWRDTTEVVTAARAVHGVEVVVLRLLSVQTESIVDGGPVAYLAEVENAPDVPLARWPEDPLADEPLRLAYARPGGPQADLAWACDALDRLGIPRTGSPRQVRTWNLSSIWQLPTAIGPAWLKVVPPFFAHEGALLSRLDRSVVPELLARSGGRMLLADIAGTDRHDATGAELDAMVELLVRLQLTWAGRTDELVRIGVPDWRAAAFVPRAQALFESAVSGATGPLDRVELRALDALVGSLAERYAAVADCGIPDGLFHGDFHPGNVRETAGRLVLLDWGDSGVGHPLLDQAAFCERLADSDRVRVLRLWQQRWRDAVPGCDPDRAARLLSPVAALRAAVVYQHFLDSIEPDERAYHRHDPNTWLRRAAAVPTGT
jgi:hypothetical protein